MIGGKGEERGGAGAGFRCHHGDGRRKRKWCCRAKGCAESGSARGPVGGSVPPLFCRCGFTSSGQCTGGGTEGGTRDRRAQQPRSIVPSCRRDQAAPGRVERWERSRQWAGARPRRQRALPCGALPAAFLPSALRRSPHSSWFAVFFLPVRTAGGAQLRPGSSEMEVPPRSNTRCWRSTDLSHPAPSPQQLCRGTLQALRSWPRPIPVWGHRRHPRATPRGGPTSPQAR